MTATRRVQALEAVPYSMSVVSAEQISAFGATDIASLATIVPGLSMYDYGARFAGATVPIIRGINATGESRARLSHLRAGPGRHLRRQFADRRVLPAR